MILGQWACLWERTGEFQAIRGNSVRRIRCRYRQGIAPGAARPA